MTNVGVAVFAFQSMEFLRGQAHDLSGHRFGVMSAAITHTNRILIIRLPPEINDILVAILVQYVQAARRYQAIRAVLLAE